MKPKHALAILLILLLELTAFLPSLRDVGFYFDDWKIMRLLHFSGKDYASLFNAYLFEPCALPRPVEQFHFPTIFYFFGVRPLPYHLVNGVFEIGAGIFFYLCMFQFSRSWLFAMCAGALFILYPTHDATHYWVLASSATLSMFVYFASLFCWNQFVLTNRKSWMISSWFLFAYSIYNYECCVPFIALNLAGSVWLREGRWRRGANWKKGLLEMIPFVLIVLSLFLYQKYFIHFFGRSLTPVTQFSPAHLADVLAGGFNVSLGPMGISFLYDRVRDGMQCFSLLWAKILLALTLVFMGGLAVYAFKQTPSNDEPFTKADYQFLTVLGVGTMLAAYSIYGFAANHSPYLFSMYNRINYGSSAGAAILLALFFYFLGQLLFKLSAKRRVLCTFLLNSSMCLILVLANWGISNVWKLSWLVQKRAWDVLLANKEKLGKNPTVIVGNIPTYAMWAPVFDGVWDFQNMMQIVLNDKNVQGGTLSERLVVSPESMKDMTFNYVVAEYKFDNLYLFMPPHGVFIKAANAKDFVDAVDKNCNTFRPTKKTMQKWKQAVEEPIQNETSVDKN
ncbi:hypothetical protein KA183_06100 [bacterium]|nr:hypothetical protein [bacterium]